MPSELHRSRIFTPLLLGVLGLAGWWLWQEHRLPDTIPNFVDDHGDVALGERLLAQYRERLEEHLDEGGKVLDLLFSEIQLFDFESLNLTPATVLADIGCGVGTLPLTLLGRGLPFARIYAVDINPRSLEFLRFALQRGGMAGAERIVPVLSRTDDIALPAGSVDHLFVVEVPDIYFALTRTGYHEGSTDEGLDATTGRLMASMAKALAPGGRLHFVYPLETRTSGEFDQDLLVAAMARHGFTLERSRRLRLKVDNAHLAFLPKRPQ